MSSAELSRWMALFRIRGEEAHTRKLAAESADGQVVTDIGLEDEDDEDDEDDGETE